MGGGISSLLTVGVGLVIGKLVDLRNQARDELNLRVRSERTIRVLEDDLKEAFSISPDYMFTTDRKGVILFANRAPPGTELNDFIGKSAFKFAPSESRDLLINKCNDVLSNGKPTQLEISGEITKSLYKMHIYPISENDRVTGLVIVSRDISKEKETELDMLYAATHDSLTNLLNRRSFVNRLEQALIRKKRRPDKLLAVIFIDLDGLKKVNDTYGHAIGDKLIIAFAEILTASIRPEDFISRHGGDEFTILVDEIEHKNAPLLVANRVINKLSKKFRLDGQDVQIDASIGIAFNEANNFDPEKIIENADKAMYRAKEQEGSKVILYKRN